MFIESGDDMSPEENINKMMKAIKQQYEGVHSLGFSVLQNVHGIMVFPS